METLEISQKFNLLPETIQQQALNYIEFLYEKYVLDNIPTLTSMELTEETKKC